MKTTFGINAFIEMISMYVIKLQTYQVRKAGNMVKNNAKYFYKKNWEDRVIAKYAYQKKCRHFGIKFGQKKIYIIKKPNKLIDY